MKLQLVAVLLFMAALAFSHSASELEEGKKLVDSNASCANLSDGQLELVGEYLMEQMHPGEAHEAMHKMMGLEEGTAAHEAVHIQMARNMYCGESSGMGMMGSGMGMMGYGGMMGMGRNWTTSSSGGMMGQGGDMMDGWGGMMGGYGTNSIWGIFNTILWLLVLAALALLVVWLYRGITGKATGDEPLAILKRRYAKGEIDKKEYESMKKELRA